MVIDDRGFREIGANCWDPAVRLEDADRHGVDVQVLSTVPVMFSYWAQPEHTADLARLLNDHIAGVVRDHPTRFAGLGTVPLQAPDLAIAELERCVRELGLPGVQIGTHVNGVNLDDPRCSRSSRPRRSSARPCSSIRGTCWAASGCSSTGCPGWSACRPRPRWRSAPLIFGGVLERLPDLRIGFAHGGGTFPGTLGRIEHGFHARPDLCAVDKSSRRASTSPATTGRPLLRRLARPRRRRAPPAALAGRRRSGSRWAPTIPFRSGRPPGALIGSLDLDPEAERLVLGGTALEFLACRCRRDREAA